MSIKFPNSPNDPLNGVIPNKAPVPFWDDPSATMYASNNYMSPWDTCMLNTKPLPGICHVQFKKHKRFDIKKVKGQTEQSISFVGYDPGEVIIVCKIWTASQLDQLAAMMPIINQKPTKNKATGKYDMPAVDVSHPSLTLLEIHSLIIDAVDGLEPSTPKGVWQMKIHCLEFKAPDHKDKSSTTKSSQNTDYSLDVSHVLTQSERNASYPSDTSSPDVSP